MRDQLAGPLASLVLFPLLVVLFVLSWAINVNFIFWDSVEQWTSQRGRSDG
jgi:hypothetical protein